eukprot:TRINITY_DN6494_c0_g1_i1.p1 TRINITY_DN6494_c0_g1~~TRINITY_DN6494_c0_g1_i1.p1  ORF type:complete len:338 (-),score=94.48 TRINITY_DN6494_c0_g1_i1:73-1086(-)
MGPKPGTANRETQRTNRPSDLTDTSEDHELIEAEEIETLGDADNHHIEEQEINEAEDSENDKDGDEDEEEKEDEEDEEKEEEKELTPDEKIMQHFSQGILPGDVLRSFELLEGEKDQQRAKAAGNAKPAVLLGPGVRQVQTQLVSTKAGVVRIQYMRKGTKYWVDDSAKRYVPTIEDQVIGIIVDRFIDHYKVDIGCSNLAILSNIAFEGATKRNKPNLQVGNLVYARVILANKDLEPEIVCYGPSTKSEGYGELKDGYMFECSQALSRSLMLPDCYVLQELGRKIPFEVASGMNGRVWVHSQSHANTILISNVITDSEFLRPAKIQAMISVLVQNK